MKKLVAKNFAIYSLPSIISKFVPFITLPITTRYLSLVDFGYIAIFELCLIPFHVLIGIGPGYIINSNWYKIDEEEKKKLIFALLVVISVFCFIGILFFGFISNLVFPLFAGDEWVKIRSLLPFLFIAAVSLIPGTIFTSWVIIEQKAKLSTIVKTIQIIAGTSTVILVAMYTQNYHYIIMGNVLVGLVIALIQFSRLMKVLRVSFEKRWFSMIYKISSPIYLRSIFNILRTQFDRILVSRLFGATQFALYNFSGKISNLFAETGEHYQNAYDPYIYKGLSEKNLDTQNIRFIFSAWVYLLIILCCIFILFGEYIINIVTNGVFVHAYPLVILYTCVYVVTLPFMGNGQVVIFFQKTKYLLIITIIQALIIILFSIVLIPKYGAAAGIFSLWLGTLVYMLLYFFKKRQLIKNNFIEKIIWPHVVLYHVIVVLTFFGYNTKANFLILVLISVFSFHFYITNRIILQRVFSNIRLKSISDIVFKN